MSAKSALDWSPEPSRHLAEQLASCSLWLARRFSDGATLWCVAPGRPDHELHVAVEFVHPVIVGTRALPAVAIVDADPTNRVRESVKQGDVVVCIGSGDTAELLEITRRGPAWGVETIWIGWGPTPHEQSCATLLWLEDGEDSSVIRTYHLLWELSQVCLEHPDVVRSVDSSQAPTCRVCADDLTLAEVATIGPNVAKVRSASGISSVDTTLVDDVGINDLVLIQAGVALQRVDGIDDE